MNIAPKESKFKTVKLGDPLFTITDGFFLSHRAGVEVSVNCPHEYRQIIIECLNRRWLAPVAYMTAEEQLIETLKL